MTEAERKIAEDVIARSAWLESCAANMPTLLLNHGRLRSLAAGQWVYGEGDDSGILIVIGGALQVFAQAPGGRDVLISQIGAGTAIGQTARFGGGPRLVTVIAVEDSLVLQATDQVLSLIAADDPQIWQAVASLLYLQLRGLVQMLAEATALPPRQRLAARLLRLAPNVSGLCELHVSQQALAEMVNLSRKSVNLYLSEFERVGLIKRNYASITIRNRSELRRVEGFTRKVFPNGENADSGA